MNPRVQFGLKRRFSPSLGGNWAQNFSYRPQSLALTAKALNMAGDKAGFWAGRGRGARSEGSLPWVGIILSNPTN